MEDENVDGSSASPPPVDTAEADGTTKCSVCKKRSGRKSECIAIPLPPDVSVTIFLHTYISWQLIYLMSPRL